MIRVSLLLSMLAVFGAFGQAQAQQIIYSHSPVYYSGQPVNSCFAPQYPIAQPLSTSQHSAVDPDTIPKYPIAQPLKAGEKIITSTADKSTADKAVVNNATYRKPESKTASPSIHKTISSQSIPARTSQPTVRYSQPVKSYPAPTYSSPFPSFYSPAGCLKGR